LVEEIRFLRGRTIYGTIGDMIAYVAMVLTAAALMMTRQKA
jgi:chromate transport protein ChrA